MSDDILNSIDGALEDYETSPDAMRWTPEPPEETEQPQCIYGTDCNCSRLAYELPGHRTALDFITGQGISVGPINIVGDGSAESPYMLRDSILFGDSNRMAQVKKRRRKDFISLYALLAITLTNSVLFAFWGVWANLIATVISGAAAIWTSINLYRTLDR